MPAYRSAYDIHPEKWDHLVNWDRQNIKPASGKLKSTSAVSHKQPTRIAGRYDKFQYSQLPQNVGRWFVDITENEMDVKWDMIKKAVDAGDIRLAEITNEKDANGNYTLMVYANYDNNHFYEVRRTYDALVSHGIVDTQSDIGFHPEHLLQVNDVKTCLCKANEMGKQQKASMLRERENIKHEYTYDLTTADLNKRHEVIEEKTLSTISALGKLNSELQEHMKKLSGSSESAWFDSSRTAYDKKINPVKELIAYLDSPDKKLPDFLNDKNGLVILQQDKELVHILSNPSYRKILPEKLQQYFDFMDVAKSPSITKRK